MPDSWQTSVTHCFALCTLFSAPKSPLVWHFSRLKRSSFLVPACLLFPILLAHQLCWAHWNIAYGLSWAAGEGMDHHCLVLLTPSLCASWKPWPIIGYPNEHQQQCGDECFHISPGMLHPPAQSEVLRPSHWLVWMSQHEKRSSAHWVWDEVCSIFSLENKKVSEIGLDSFKRDLHKSMEERSIHNYQPS